ncbi:MAG: TonB family protein, partial [Polyangiales bacterium]
MVTSVSTVARAQAPGEDAAGPSAPPVGDASSDSTPPVRREADDAAATADAAQDTPPKARFRPPRLLYNPAPVYPKDVLTEVREPTIFLRVLLSETGAVEEVAVDGEGHPAFVDAAMDTVRQWRFEPAERDGEAIASWVRVALYFALPRFDLSSKQASAAPAVPGKTAAPPAASAAPSPAKTDEQTRYRAVAESDAAKSPLAAGDFVVDREVLSAAPAQDGGDLLAHAPGFFVSRPEGGAVGGRILLRGFDADHGQDIEFHAAGVPLNQVSHIHGQGYTDLSFIPARAVRSLRVLEGVYDPRQGDFAVAGSVNFDLAVEERGLLKELSYGSFSTVRSVFLWAPEGEPDESFGYVGLSRSNGFGARRGGRAATAMGQYAFRLGQYHGVLHGAFHGARSNLAGVVRLDDVEAGRVDFDGVYDLPTADSQSAMSSRTQMSVRLGRKRDDQSHTEFTLFGTFNDFHLRENFTGFVQSSRANPDFVGRGDLIDQSNRSWTWGARGAHRSRHHRIAPWLQGHSEVGLVTRFDHIT